MNNSTPRFPRPTKLQSSSSYVATSRPDMTASKTHHTSPLAGAEIPPPSQRGRPHFWRDLLAVFFRCLRHKDRRGCGRGHVVLDFLPCPCGAHPSTRKVEPKFHPIKAVRPTLSKPCHDNTLFFVFTRLIHSLDSRHIKPYGACRLVSETLSLQHSFRHSTSNASLLPNTSTATGATATTDYR